MQEQFVLGFIAGEGSFHARLKQDEYSKFGVETSLQFTLLVHDKDKKLLDSIVNYIGVGTVSHDESRNRIYWKVSSKSGCRELVSFIEQNKEPFFELSDKYEAYERWRALLEQVDELAESREGKEYFIRQSKKINDGGNRGLSADEWVARLTE